MRRLKVTLWGLMVLVIVAAVGLTALRFPTPLVAATMWTGTLTLLHIAAILAFLEKRRGFWTGVAVFGLGYAVFAMLDGRVMPGNLISKHILQAAYAWSIEPQIKVSLAGGVVVPTSWREGSTLQNYPYRDGNVTEFFHVGHSLFALLHGAAGGMIAVWIRRRLDRREQ